MGGIITDIKQTIGFCGIVGCWEHKQLYIQDLRIWLCRDHVVVVGGV